MDNHNTHRLASVYETFEPADARRLASRLEIHYTPNTPVSSTWPRSNSAFSLASAWIARLPDQAEVECRVATWAKKRKAADSTVDWRFAAADARIEIKNLYRKLQDSYLTA